MKAEAIILDIMAEAMRATNEGAANVFVDYSGHVKHLIVEAHPIDQGYLNGDKTVYLINKTVYLNDDNVIGQLDNLHAELAALRAANNRKAA